MSRSLERRAFALCLFISNQYDDAEFVEVETVRPISKVGGIDSLDVQYWIRVIEGGRVYDGTDHRFIFSASESQCDQFEHQKFVCIALRPWKQGSSWPADRRGLVNSTMQNFLNNDCQWYGNALIVACSATGEVIDFSETARRLFQTILKNATERSDLQKGLTPHLSTSSSVHCDHTSQSPVLDTAVFSPKLSMELYIMFMRYADIRSLVTMSNYNDLLSRAIGHMFMVFVVDRMKTFIPTDRLGYVFHILRDCQAIFYGIVPFQILTRRTWAVNLLQVAVNKANFDKITALFSELGYREAETMQPGQGIFKIVRMRCLEINSEVVITRDINELIHVVMPPKYMNPDMPTFIPSIADEEAVGRLHDSTLLPDYKESLFKDPNNRVVQQAIYDVDQSLVRPWDQYQALRPGTIVLVTAALQRINNHNLTQWRLEMESIKILIPADLTL
ncbi:hypothetical protein EYR38_003337 [Pleurotus pulmonarius]|nr:hypothetical protein EYR38_003337 [Pleurotus pulmonarius]